MAAAVAAAVAAHQIALAMAAAVVAAAPWFAGLSFLFRALVLPIRSHVVWVVQVVQKAQTPMVVMARLVVAVFFRLDRSRSLRLAARVAKHPLALLISAMVARVAR